MIEDVLFDQCQAVLGLLDPSTEQVNCKSLAFLWVDTSTIHCMFHLSSPYQLTVRRAVHPLLLRLGDRVAELKAQVEASTQEVRILHKLLLLLKLLVLLMLVLLKLSLLLILNTENKKENQ